MSEKIKGMFGSETRPNEVIEWLKSQGADAMQSIENFKDSEAIFYVNKDKEVMKLHITCAELFDIVKLPRWRAKYDEKYYFVSECGKACCSNDIRDAFDNDRFNLGNYFKTYEEAEQYAKKFREIFKKKRGDNVRYRAIRKIMRSLQGQVYAYKQTERRLCVH